MVLSDLVLSDILFTMHRLVISRSWFYVHLQFLNNSSLNKEKTVDLRFTRHSTQFNVIWFTHRCSTTPISHNVLYHFDHKYMFGGSWLILPPFCVYYNPHILKISDVENISTRKFVQACYSTFVLSRPPPWFQMSHWALVPIASCHYIQMGVRGRGAVWKSVALKLCPISQVPLSFIDFFPVWN